MSDVKLRRATAADVAGVRACVEHAYARYEGRLPRPPKPVLADYEVVIRETDTWLLETSDSLCVGVLVLVPEADHLLLENIAVEPGWQGRGLGRRLLELAESECRRL